MSRNVEIPTSGKRHGINVDMFPSECGLCHKNVDPTYISGVFIDGYDNSSSNVLELVFQCTNVECRSLIIGYFRRTQKNVFEFVNNAPLEPTKKEFSDEINSVSENFIEIYNEAYFAEQKMLTLISGIGYRKAIEFLVKDYLIFLNKDDETSILARPLGQCINTLENENIKEIAKRATWIGNDEAHYQRKWEGKDIEDLKKLIEVTTYFISMDVASKKYLEEMS
ncbi:DUF4145 domain-containing protein [Salimicrobium humidisoli]|uniref:DUF4145 domain-containing protein n=1 Tax=Salimicrobium humidisoli TaxID=2029857 RepID=A0ABX4HNU0_9BACI|nr:DUF4145 domain-containing protein [Salimicrobium humidisoli]PBB04760.1 hypothetical protein CKW00_12315 [Salimicrobium humidisoli]